MYSPINKKKVQRISVEPKKIVIYGKRKIIKNKMPLNNKIYKKNNK